MDPEEDIVNDLLGVWLPYAPFSLKKLPEKKMSKALISTKSKLLICIQNVN